MKDVLTMQNLTATHYDGPDHILQFEPGDGRKIFVTVRGLGPVDDEFYWDDEDTLARALAKVEEDDIEVQEPAMRALRAATGMTRKAFADYFEIPVRTIEDWEAGRRQPPAYVEKLIAYKIEKERIKMTPMTVDKIIEDSNLTLKDKRFVRRLINTGILQVRKEDFPLFEHWLENENLTGYYPTFYGGYNPEVFQEEQIDQFGEEVDLEDRQWYTVLPEGIIEYADEAGWWK